MPLFEYECQGCNRTVELLVRSSEERVACPECGGQDLTQLMSAPAAPSKNGQNGSLPMASRGESCGAPRCCGGVCH